MRAKKEKTVYKGNPTAQPLQVEYAGVAIDKKDLLITGPIKSIVDDPDATKEGFTAKIGFTTAGHVRDWVIEEDECIWVYTIQDQNGAKIYDSERGGKSVLFYEGKGTPFVTSSRAGMIKFVTKTTTIDDKAKSLPDTSILTDGYKIMIQTKWLWVNDEGERETMAKGAEVFTIRHEWWVFITDAKNETKEMIIGENVISCVVDDIIPPDETHHEEMMVLKWTAKVVPHP